MVWLLKTRLGSHGSSQKQNEFDIVWYFCWRITQRDVSKSWAQTANGRDKCKTKTEEPLEYSITLPAGSTLEKKLNNERKSHNRKPQQKCWVWLKRISLNGERRMGVNKKTLDRSEKLRPTRPLVNWVSKLSSKNVIMDDYHLAYSSTNSSKARSSIALVFVYWMEKISCTDRDQGTMKASWRKYRSE